MKIGYFYAHSCREKIFYNSLQRNRRKEKEVLKQAISLMSKGLLSHSQESEILAGLEHFLNDSLPQELFSFTWMKEKYLATQVMKYRRFLSWYQDLGVIEVCDANVDIAIPFVSDCLQSQVHLIVKLSNGSYGAITIFNGVSKKGLMGKGVHTNLNTDLYTLVAKKCLEAKYPGILIYSIYLSHEEDSLGSIRTSFEEGTKRGSNVFCLPFKEYYKNGVFDHHQILATISKVVKEPLPKNCYGCMHEKLCNLNTISHLTVLEEIETDIVEEESLYTLPDFTASQEEVVTHVDGPCMVCAGPGSGKTAALVGRIKYLVDSGIDADYILAVTFSRAAAGEIEQRVAGVLPVGAGIPCISTLHSLAYDILQHNSKRVGKKVQLLTAELKDSILSGLLEAYGPLTGFYYPISDNTSVIKNNLEEKLEKFFSFSGSVEEFLKEEKKLGYDFISLAKSYKSICEAEGYITYSEQITLCIQLFKDYPEVLDAYRQVYRYILVDEFQDVDAEQAVFITMLAAEHRNLMVIGDDDQSIYHFRGGSPKFMLKFKDTFPEAKVIYLSENFRSTKSLVAAAQQVIEKNPERLEKTVVSGKDIEGVAPVLINSTENATTLIKSLRKKGMEYEDIAILSSKNSTLEKQAEELQNNGIDCILERKLLVDDPFYGILLDCLQMADMKMADDYTLCHFLKLFEVNPEDIRNTVGTVSFESVLTGRYEDYCPSARPAFQILRTVFEYIEQEEFSPVYFVHFLAFLCEAENCTSLSTILEILEEQSVGSMQELLKCLLYMEPDKRVMVESNTLRLMTVHESKGREFKAVVFIDDFKNEVTDEKRRLYYVAMTRAKEELYILYNNNSLTTALMV